MKRHMLTVREAARFANVDTTTIYEWVRTGRILASLDEAKGRMVPRPIPFDELVAINSPRATLFG